MTTLLRWSMVWMVCLGLGGSAAAQTGWSEADSGVEGEALPPPPGAYPVTFTERPLTLPALTVRGSLGFQLIHFDLGPMFTDFSTAVGTGIGFGIVDDLEVGLGASPIASTLQGVYATSALRGLGGVTSPEEARGFIQPELYGRYRFFASDVAEVGAELAFSLPTDDTDFGLSVGVPARLRFGGRFALDLALAFFTAFGEDVMGDLDPFFTLGLNVNPRYAMELFYVGLETGFVMPLENPETTFIPLGLETGATFGVDEALVLDVFAHGGLPYLLAPGADGDKALTEIWTLGFGVRVHYGFAAGAP